MKRVTLVLFCLMAIVSLHGQAQAPAPTSVLLKPARVFDGVTAQPHEGWVVLVTGNRIAAAGPPAEVNAPAGVKVVDLPGMTLLPGLIDCHTHLEGRADKYDPIEEVKFPRV